MNIYQYTSNVDQVAPTLHRSCGKPQYKLLQAGKCLGRKYALNVACSVVLIVKNILGSAWQLTIVTRRCADVTAAQKWSIKPCSGNTIRKHLCLQSDDCVSVILPECQGLLLNKLSVEVLYWMHQAGELYSTKKTCIAWFLAAGAFLRLLAITVRHGLPPVVRMNLCSYVQS